MAASLESSTRCGPSDATDPPDGAGGHRPSVYISAGLSPSGIPAQLMRRWRRRPFDMIVSTKLIDELDRTLHRDRFRPYIALDDVDDLIDELRRRGDPADDPEHAAPISRDPNDDYLIGLALETDADAFVSGHRDLTDLVDPPVRILTPRDLLDERTSTPGTRCRTQPQRGSAVRCDGWR